MACCIYLASHLVSEGPSQSADAKGTEGMGVTMFSAASNALDAVRCSFSSCLTCGEIAAQILAFRVARDSTQVTALVAL